MAKTETYYLFEDDMHVYTGTVKHKKSGEIIYKLFRSEHHNWLEPRKLVLKARDDGWGIKIIGDGLNMKNLYYYHMTELQHLTNLIIQYSNDTDRKCGYGKFSVVRKKDGSIK